MTTNGFYKGIIIGLGLAVILLFLLFFAAPYIYWATENKNFEENRKRSALNCQTMPLHCLVRDGKMDEISNYAISHKNLELKDNWGMTALFWALNKNKPLMVTQLLSLKADPNTKDENGIFIFYRAVTWGRYRIADELLAAGANINAFNGNQYPETALHYCVMKNKPKCVRYLIDKGADVSLKDSFGYTVFDRLKTHDFIGIEVAELLKNPIQK